jgi:amidophosphoribosyltransferase
VPKDDLCRACFDGVYPVDLPEPRLLGKHLLEQELDAPLRPDGLSTTMAGGGAPDALSRP